MKQNRDCKIVQDLMPTYVEGLTDEVTNEYIEEHIANCSECAQMLKDMNGDIQLEKITQDKEIKYLKKWKNRIKICVLIVALLGIIAAIGVAVFMHYDSQIKVANYTYLKASCVVDEPDTKDGKLYITLMAVIDNKGICQSARIIDKGYNEYIIEEKKQIYDTFEKVKVFSNIQMIDDEIHYSLNTWNGWTKEETIKYWKQYYNVDKIEEI